MNRLIINTANDELFIVLQEGNNLFSKTINSKMHHNETMLPEIDKILTEHKLKVTDIDDFGVVVGPGSFTGIRVGVSTIKAFRDVAKKSAKGINNLDFLFMLAKDTDPNVETVAINGSRDSYFVAKLINGIVYKYERNLTKVELEEIAENKPIGMFKKDDNLKCFEVSQNAEKLIECFENSSDETLVPVYYQLSQAENEKLKRSDVEIIKADREDLEKITALETNNILTNLMTKEQILSALTNENYFVYKAEVGGEVVGFIMLQKTDELNVDSVAVNKEYRNLGIATRLINKAEELAKLSNIHTLSLEVSHKNITAYLLYKKLGFVERRVRKNYYSDGSNAIEMIKNI